MAIFIGIYGTCLSSFVLSIEMLNLLLHVTQALFVTRRRHQLTCRPHLTRSSRQAPTLNELVNYPSNLFCRRDPNFAKFALHDTRELSEVSAHSVLKTRTILLPIRLHRAICTHLDNCAGCLGGVRHTEVLNAVTRLEVESSDSDPGLYPYLSEWYAVVLCVCS